MTQFPPSRLPLAAALACLLAWVGCEKSAFENDTPAEELTAEAYPLVDEELWPYFAAYEAAAAERGVDVDLREEPVRAFFLSSFENGVAGECRYNPDHPNEVSLDRDTWEAVSQRLREYIVFHELGHCERRRKHREDAGPTGLCLSVMASGTGSCSENYTPSTRDALLDELFDPQFYGEWPE